MSSGLNFDKQMGVISKYSNLYDKDGNFLHKPGNYTIKEVEDLLDSIEDKDSGAYKNTMAVLMSMYEKYGNPHEDEIIQKINDYAKSKTTKSGSTVPHTSKAEVVEALNTIAV